MSAIAPRIVSEGQNLDRIFLDGREIVLVGTAHISHDSVELAQRTIEREQPDSVCVELCASRYESLRDPDRWRKTDILDVLRSGKGYVLLTQLFLVGFQRKLGDQLNISPGAEMLASIHAAERVGAEIVLADREIRTTLKRAWASMSPYRMVTLLSALVAGLFGRHEIDAQEIERLKSSDALEEAMKEFAEAMPQVRTALIDERDQYLASKIAQASGPKVVAIVGAGHVPGIKRLIGTEIDLDIISVVPPQSWWFRSLRWFIPAIVLGLILYAAFAFGAELSIDMIERWVWVVGSFAAVGAIVSLAHPLSVVAAFFAAPLTPFNPVIKAGRAAALTEAVLRKPRVEDFEHIAVDMATLRGIFHNRVSRVLLVLVLTTGMNWIGIVWGVQVVASLLGESIG